MLATLGGCLALLVGLAVLVLPLLVPELSRARDSVWGALVLLLGLALVTSAERLTGSPMLVVLCGGLLLGRLGSEVALGRWQQLSPEERQALRAAERWQRSLEQLGATGQQLLAGIGALSSALPLRRPPRLSGKRWIRQEPGAAAPPPGAPASAPEPEAPPQAAADQAGPPPANAGTMADDDDTITVTSFAAIDALIASPSAAPPTDGEASEAGSGAG